MKDRRLATFRHFHVLRCTNFVYESKARTRLHRVINVKKHSGRALKNYKIFSAIVRLLAPIKLPSRIPRDRNKSV